jgi:hypothetical protein
VYGLGQKTGPSNRRGRKLVLWNTDILAPDVLQQQRVFEADVTRLGTDPSFDPYYTSIPFFYHARLDVEGAALFAGFFIDNGYKASFDFTDKHRFRYLFRGGQYTEYVFAGPNVPRILQAYSSLTGRMQPPPLWSLGHHQCRWKDYSQDELLAIGRHYREKSLPCDSLWLDIGYMDGYRVYTWNKERFSDVPKMMKAAESDGFKVVTIIDPGVKFEPGYSVFEEGRAQGVFCKTEAGKQEIQDRGRKLPASLRSLLLMVDGQRDHDQLRELMKGLHAPDDALEQLAAMGLVVRDEPAPTVAASLAAAPLAPLPGEVKLPADFGRYRSLYEIVSDTVRRHLGLKGYFMQLKVEKCADVDQLLALLPEIATALTKAKDHTFASEWLARTRAEIQG